MSRRAEQPALFGGLAPASLIRPGADMSKLNTILDAQNPNLKIAAPVLLAQGLSDTTVLPFMTNSSTPSCAPEGTRSPI